MFDELLIHPRTRLQLDAFMLHPTHGLILTGPQGSGKRTLAAAVAAHMLSTTTDGLANYPYYSLTDPSDPTITIDEVRALQRLLTLKTPRRDEQGIRRILTIIDAGRMRSEAQNAFLKSLEEPPSDTCIILTAEANGSLLSTIYSRVQRVEVLPVSESSAQDYYKQRGIAASLVSRNYALAQGQPGLLHSLLTDDIHPLKDSVENAKSLLGQPVPDRLKAVEDLSKDKIAVGLLLNAFGRIAHAALTASAKTNNAAAISRWKTSSALIQDSKSALSKNANVKLLLDHLLLNL